jgi:cell division protein ZapA
MAQVIVSIADNPYTMNCPDGEEDHLQDLARLLDTEVQRIRRSVGSVGEIRLLVMSGLMVADRLSEAIKRIEELEGQHAALREARQTAQREKADAEIVFAEKLEEAAKRLDDLSRAINQAA